jgi:hypothetical protein
VVVGPVASHSAKIWVTHAREVLDDEDMAPDIAEAFGAYLDEWEGACTGPEFRWEVEIPAETVEYHFHLFHTMATRLIEERRGIRVAPPEGDSFYLALVNGVLSALEDENDACKEFAAHLRAFWPGDLGQSVR